jgi:hypothetical protein
VPSRQRFLFIDEVVRKNIPFEDGMSLGELTVVLTDIGDNLAYQHGLHFCCQEVYPYRNLN